MITAFKILTVCYFSIIVLGFMFIYLSVREKYKRTVLKPGEVNLFNDLELKKEVSQNITYSERGLK